MQGQSIQYWQYNYSYFTLVSLQLAKETKDINKKQKKDPKARGLKPCIRYPSCAMRHSLSYCNPNTFVPGDLKRPKTNQLLLISTNIKLLLKITLLGKTCKVVEDEDGGWFYYYVQGRGLVALIETSTTYPIPSCNNRYLI